MLTWEHEQNVFKRPASVGEKRILGEVWDNLCERQYAASVLYRIFARFL